MKGYYINLDERAVRREQFESQELPADFELSQNYPNPFNPTTTISYSVPEKGLITLKVYNLMGQEMAELVNCMKNEGTHQVIFDASQLSSGVYFYKLKVGAKMQIRKMILAK